MRDRRNIRRGILARATAVCALAALASLGGCRVQPLTIPGKARDPREMPGSTTGRGPRETEAAVSSKRVAGKEPPTTLVAEDGSRCTVTESKYGSTRIGDTVFCAWRTNDRAP